MSGKRNKKARINGRGILEYLLVALFCFVLSGLNSNMLFSQVITNQGAYVNIIPGTIVQSDDVINNSGTLFNSGTISISGNYISTGTTGGNGVYTLGGSWTNTGGTFNPGLSTVIFNGSDDQFITRTGGETFFNMTVENTGAPLSKRLVIQNNVTILGTLTMSVGNIDAGSYLLYLSNPFAASLNYISTSKSRILGMFERGISETADYLFPLGTTSFYNPLNFKTNNLFSSGSVLSQYFALDPGNEGLPVPDPPVEVFDSYPDGYWSLTSKGGFSVSDFNISLNAEGFADTIWDITRAIKRTSGGNWSTDGIHRDASAIVVHRDNLTGDISTSGTQFALGRIRPLIISHPIDTTVCEGANPTFRVIASGAERLKYAWYKEPGILIENGQHYEGARTPVLTILKAELGDIGEYYCIISDRYRNSVKSNKASLVVMKIPVATATPALQPHECSDMAFEDIILGLDYWDPGTTFVWVRNNPDGIESQIPMSGSANNIGDALSGSFINKSNNPLTITFLITAIGPSPTYCAGNAIKATVTVNPTPLVILQNAAPVICYGESTSIKLLTPNTMTKGDIVFDYTVSFQGKPGQIIGNNSPGTVSPGNIINYSYENNSDTVLSVFYTIIPKNNSLACKYDSIAIPEVKVHPKPLQDLFISTPFTCAGGLNGVITAILAKGSKPDTLTWTDRPWLGDTTYTTILNSDSMSIRYAGEYNLTVQDSYGCKNSINGLEVLGTTFITNLYVNDTTGYGTICPGMADGEMWIWESMSSTAKAPFEYWLVFNEEDTIRSGIIADKEIYIHEYNLPAGYYKLIIKDANGCYNQNYPQIEITKPPDIDLSFQKSDYNGYNIRCRGYDDGFVKAISVTGGNGGPFSYHWETEGGYISGPDNTDRLDNIPAGNYYLNTTDRKGCLRRDTVIITQPEGMELIKLELSSSPDGIYNISCHGGNDGSIDLTVSGGKKPYSYFWTDSLSFTAETEDLENISAGIYVCKVTDSNGCELKIPSLSIYPSATLNEPAPLLFNAAISTYDDGTYNINCNGGNGWINLNVTGGSNGSYEYTWSTEDGSAPVQGQGNQPFLKAGTYHVRVRDANLCEKDTVIILTEPNPVTATLIPTHIACYPPGFNNGSINLTPSGGIAPYSGFSWSNGAVTEDISGLTADYYSVTFKDANGCDYTDGVSINLPPPITYQTVVSDYNGFNVSCNGRSDGWISITMNSGLAPYIYDWQKIGDGFSATSDSISDLGSGFYILNIKDANMCSAFDTIEIREQGIFGINIIKSESIAGGFNINCAGASTGSVEIEPVNYAGSVTYLWSDGAGTAVRTNIPAGDYNVYVEDGNGCLIDSLFTLTEPDSIKLSFSVTPPWCPDKPDGMVTLEVTGGVTGTDYTYNWSDGSAGSEITDIVEGTFVVSVTDMNGCMIRDSVVVEPLNEICLIIPNAFSPNGDLINDVWNIGLIELYPNVEIRIFNRWGSTVWKSERGYPRPWDGRSNGSLLPIDSYHYIIDLGPGRKPVIGNVTIVR